MIITIHQPNFLPWLGFFEKISHAQTYVVLDNVQFIRDGFIHRTRIRTKEGWIWLTIPCHFKFTDGPSIKDIRIDYTQKWVHKHLMAIRSNYAKAPFFNEYFPVLENLYNQKWEFVADFNIAIIEFVLENLGITIPVVRASTLSVEGRSTDLLLAICRQYDAKTYLAGPSGRKYMEVEKFDAAGIAVDFHHFHHPEYSQVWPGFQPLMSIIDLFMCHGPESKALLTGAAVAPTPEHDE